MRSSVYLDSGTVGKMTQTGSDDHALVTARLREVLLQRVLCWSRACATVWPMVMHNEGAWRWPYAELFRVLTSSSLAPGDKKSERDAPSTPWIDTQRPTCMIYPQMMWRMRIVRDYSRSDRRWK